MEKIIGKIETINLIKEGEKFGKKWKLYGVKVGGVDYSGFGNEGKDPYCHYSEGDNIELEFEKNGEYNNIKSVKISNPEAEKKYEELVDNSLNKEMNDSVGQMILEGIFKGEFNINGDAYEISIKKK